MQSITVLGASALKPGEMKKFHVAETDLLIANIEGTFYCISNTCTHMGGSLADGILTDGIVKCPRHGAEYDVKTGKCVGALTMFFVKKKTGDVKAYPVQLIDGNVVVEI